MGWFFDKNWENFCQTDKNILKYIFNDYSDDSNWYLFYLLFGLFFLIIFFLIIN